MVSSLRLYFYHLHPLLYISLFLHNGCKFYSNRLHSSFRTAASSLHFWAFPTTQMLWSARIASTREARARICGALREIAERHRGQSVAVVSHGAVIRQALAATKGLSIQETKSEILGPNTCVALLEFDGDAFRIVFQSDVSHLGAMEAAASICP